MAHCPRKMRARGHSPHSVPPVSRTTAPHAYRKSTLTPLATAVMTQSESAHLVTELCGPQCSPSELRGPQRSRMAAAREVDVAVSLHGQARTSSAASRLFVHEMIYLLSTYKRTLTRLHVARLRIAINGNRTVLS